MKSVSRTAQAPDSIRTACNESQKLRELVPAGGKRKERRPGQLAATGSSDFVATKVGSINNISVLYDPALGPQGLALSRELLNAVSGPYSDLEAMFGISGGGIEVIVASVSGLNDGSGGAYHFGCNFTSGGVLYLDATFANKTVNPVDLAVGLYVAELSECFMGAQGIGWGCESSNGEGLSRFCAEQETPPGTMNHFATGPDWAKAGYPNWIDRTEFTDRNHISTGCAVVYIYWMRSLGFTIPEIIQAGGATLAANYKKLTGKTTAYKDLMAALFGLNITSDNPFPIKLQSGNSCSTEIELATAQAMSKHHRL